MYAQVVASCKAEVFATAYNLHMGISLFDDGCLVLLGSIIYHYHLQWTIIEGDGINHRTGIIETVVIDSDDRYDGFQRCLIRLCLYS